jgi:hypothetical protein
MITKSAFAAVNVSRCRANSGCEGQATMTTSSTSDPTGTDARRMLDRVLARSAFLHELANTTAWQDLKQRCSLVRQKYSGISVIDDRFYWRITNLSFAVGGAEGG